MLLPSSLLEAFRPNRTANEDEISRQEEEVHDGKSNTSSGDKGIERLRHSTSAICGKIGENKDTVSQVD